MSRSCAQLLEILCPALEILCPAPRTVQKVIMIPVICGLLYAVGLAQSEPVSVCRPTGERYFISDSAQCDRFHMCDEEGRLAAEFLCQDGLVYEPISKQCGLPFKIDCIGSGRTKLQVEG